MPSIIVRLTAALTAPEAAQEIACEATTVRDALLAVVAQAPQYEQRIFYGDRLLVTVAVNGRHVPPANAAAAPLAMGDRVDVLPPVAGG